MTDQELITKWLNENAPGWFCNRVNEQSPDLAIECPNGHIIVVTTRDMADPIFPGNLKNYIDNHECSND